MYFKSTEKKENKNNSEDELFFYFIDHINSSDVIDVHDIAIRSVRKYYGDITEENIGMVQKIIERYLGEPRIPNNMVMDEKVEVHKETKETTDKFKKLNLL